VPFNKRQEWNLCPAAEALDKFDAALR